MTCSLLEPVICYEICFVICLLIDHYDLHEIVILIHGIVIGIVEVCEIVIDEVIEILIPNVELNEICYEIAIVVHFEIETYFVLRCVNEIGYGWLNGMKCLQ